MYNVEVLEAVALDVLAGICKDKVNDRQLDACGMLLGYVDGVRRWEDYRAKEGPAEDSSESQ